MDPVAVLRRNGGAARLETLKKARVPRRALATALDDGRVRRPLRGTYAVPEATRAAILGAAYRANLSCTSACVAMGLPVMEPDPRVHLWVPRDRARRASDTRPVDGVVIHRHDHATSNARERVLVGLDLMGRCTDRMQQIIAIDAALHKGLMLREEIDAFVHTDPARRRWLRDRCDPKAQSPIETIVRVACVEAGLRVRSQVHFPGVGHVDFVVEGRQVVETDGAGYHNNQTAWEEDQRRARALTLAGWPPLHFTYADVTGNLPGVIAQIKAAVGKP